MTRWKQLLVLAAAAAMSPLAGQAEEARPSLVKANTRFAIALYRRLKDEAAPNMFFSPYSIAGAATLVFAGARGTTADAMAGALHLPMRGDELFGAWRDFTEELVSHRGEGAVLSVANSLWVQRKAALAPEYVQTADRYFNAAVESVDYVQGAEAARAAMNAWAEKNTQGKIHEMMPAGALDAMTRLVVLNAVYFKGAWKTKFDPQRTHDGEFRTRAGETVRVPMMSLKGSFPYLHQAGVQVLHLPYRNDAFSMVLVMPDDPARLAVLEEELNLQSLQQWVSAPSPTEVQIVLPRFSISYRTGLKPALSAMGMARAFDPGKADFSGFTGGKNDLYLSRVLHKAFLEVNEEGSEAAAASAGVLNVRSARIVPEMRLDRPFLFLIRDTATGVLLFLGRVGDPRG